MIVGIMRIAVREFHVGLDADEQWSTEELGPSGPSGVLGGRECVDGNDYGGRLATSETTEERRVAACIACRHIKGVAVPIGDVGDIQRLRFLKRQPKQKSPCTVPLGKKPPQAFMVRKRSNAVRQSVLFATTHQRSIRNVPTTHSSPSNSRAKFLARLSSQQKP